MKNPCKHPVIVLTGIKFEHLNCLIDFIYNGEVNIFEENLSELLRIANILKIKGLASEEAPSFDDLNEIDNTGSAVDDQREIESHSVTNVSENIFLDSLVNLKNELNVVDVKNVDKTIPIPECLSVDTELSKKRKSVSFSEKPEILADESNSGHSAIDIDQFRNRRRKLRSSIEIMPISNLKQTNNNDELNEMKQPEITGSLTANHFTGNFQPIIAAKTTEPVMKKSRNSTSRKMIRKNENFLRALEAVRTQGIGFCKAAKMHGVNNRTLWLEYQKLGYPMKNARKKP